ncbi:MAG: hypothetical protein DMD65_00100 [Gemmatimonadetes bacterium]|nr:MAG: hypothetical protein DMD65_00100 [Gemmatimonadota bacterium]
MPGELIRREALERIIQRAAELQAGERDIGEGLTEADVLALGQDVGIPTRYLRQALLEEQTRSVVTGGTGLFAWLTGPSLLTAERVVPGDRGAVERALTVWMEREESLQVKRRYADRTTWEPRVGAFASIQRALGAGGKTFALARATEVGGQVTQLETGFCHVRLVADVRGERARRLWGAALLVLWGAVLAGVLPALGALAPWAAIPTAVAWAAALAVARRHRRENERIQVGLEQVLDRVEHGEIKPEHALPGSRVTTFARIAEEFRKAFDTPPPGARPRS